MHKAGHESLEQPTPDRQSPEDRLNQTPDLRHLPVGFDSDLIQSLALYGRLAKDIRPNNNSNNNIKTQFSGSSPQPRSKSPRFDQTQSSEYRRENEGGRESESQLGVLELAALQRQAMQLAFLQQQSTIKSQEKPDIPSSPEEDINPMSVAAGYKNPMAAAMASGGLPNPSNAQQMQQFLSQQVISPQHLQAIMQQQAFTAQQHQAQQIQEFYRQQQKQIQDIQIQLAAAKQQKKVESNDVIAHHGNGMKLSNEQQLQQHLALQQLVHLQQMQQQQQQAAAAALQQHGLATAVAMAQGRQGNLPQGPNLTTDMTPTDIQQLILKHVAETTKKDSPQIHHDRQTERSRDHSMNGEAPEMRRISNPKSPRENSPVPQSAPHPLYAHGVCKWPGCDVECSDVMAFHRHINRSHSLDDKSTAQCRVQMQVVEQLEKQLKQERERLDAMTSHLNGKEKQESRDERVSMEPTGPSNGRQEAMEIRHQSLPGPNNNNNSHHGMALAPFSTQPVTSRTQNTLSLPSSPISNPHLGAFPSTFFPPATSVPSSPPLYNFSTPSVTSGSREAMSQATKRRHSAAVPISTDLTQNQEFYRNADVRPPFTYASLIRQAVLEAPDHQMTLNEIYNWFQKKFAYFRRNAPTWKNAVRHNLSLHKCFVRVENVKGAVWTVDENEYQKRRPQKFSGSPSIRNRMETPSSAANFYSNPMNLATMQMALGDNPFQAQLVSQAAMFGASPTAYGTFLPAQLMFTWPVYDC
uniref:Fork-head domain-containing protein n=1 Tax=Ciona savignyi TaxID=51511 RepID=H2ZER6_CIOSA